MRRDLALFFCGVFTVSVGWNLAADHWGPAIVCAIASAMCLVHATGLLVRDHAAGGSLPPRREPGA